MTIPPESFNDATESPTHEMNISADNGVVEQDTNNTARSIEDMTLAEILSQFWRAPAQIGSALVKVLSAPVDKPVTDLKFAEAVADSQQPAGISRQLYRLTSILLSGVDPDNRDASDLTSDQQREAVQLGFRLTALVIGLYGSSILAAERVEAFGLYIGLPYLIIAFFVWIAADIYGLWPNVVEWRKSRSAAATRAGVNQTLSKQDSDDEIRETSFYESRSWVVRLILVSVGLVFSILAAWLNSSNRFTVPGIIAWIVSILLWVAALAPREWSFSAVWSALRSVRIARNATLWALLIIILVGAYFRLNQISTVPPEMTSDHVEKVLDAQRILDGNTQVFFPNNGGREPMQFYMLAALKDFFGMPLNFLTLKLLTAFEGIVSILLLWWMGREIVGTEDRRLGNIVGLILATLVAVSYWHTALSRLGLRIILTVSFTALLIIFLSRALRFNKRGDYIKAGLVLGFGLYAYQAVRMLPVVILVGFSMTIFFRGFGTRFGRRGDWQLQRYIYHLVVLVVIALVVFVPLLTFSLQWPGDFWRRTSGRLLGDDLIQTMDEQGNIVERVATLEERIEAFKQNWPILTDNIRNALLMYNWKGDVAWINAAPNRPAMDVFTGTLLILGLAAWVIRMFRRRDVVDWLIPVMLFIMLLPSALSIAYPVENPSATRTSGTLPEAYLLAAFPLGLICLQIMRLAPKRGTAIATVLVAALALGAYNSNQNVYFGEYRYFYAGSSLPYSDAGAALKGFAESGGSYGNAFMIAYPYWWDHRAIGIEAGLLDWPNGIVTREDTPRFLFDSAARQDRYQLNPDKDLLFFYSIADERTEEQLREWFPAGYAQVFQSYQPEDNFKIYRVPAPGDAVLIDFFVRSNVAG